MLGGIVGSRGIRRDRNDVDGAPAPDPSAPSGPKRRLGSPDWHQASDPASSQMVMTRRLSPHAERYGRAQAPQPTNGFLVTPEQVHDFVSNMQARTHSEWQALQATMLRHQTQLTDEDAEK